MTRRSNGASAAAAVLAAWAAPAVAQTLPLAPLPQQPIVATPLPPLDGQDAVPEAPAPGGAAAPRSPVVAAFPNAWQPRASATLIALDKVNARSASIVVLSLIHI